MSPRPRAVRGTAAWQPVIGLEVHCQLGTLTKLFCPCPVEFGAPPNSRVCPVCSGAPGTLPRPNAEAVRLALRAGLSLGCRIDPESRFDRKHYFYCDLPKGYQISQFERPIASGGALELASGKQVRLRRIHIEEDAGKAIHDRGPYTLVDLNRAGVPLIEIVSEPDLASSAEAHEYLTRLKEELQYAGISDCDMEKGSLRCDVNVSVHRPGEPWGTRTELKNLNSFRNVVAALEHEIARQTAVLGSGGEIAQETRLWDADRGESRVMRSKENEDDYRYFPDPDLPPVVLSPAEIETERGTLAESPALRRWRWQSELGITAYTAGVLATTRELAEFFEHTAHACGNAREAANWLANDVLAAVAEARVGSPRELGLSPERLGLLIDLVQDETLSKSGAKAVLRAMLEDPRPPAELVAELGLAQVNDPERIEAWCREALEGQERAVADVRHGELKALGALIGRAMKASGGKANPERVRATLLGWLVAAPRGDEA